MSKHYLEKENNYNDIKAYNYNDYKDTHKRVESDQVLNENRLNKPTGEKYNSLDDSKNYRPTNYYTTQKSLSNTKKTLAIIGVTIVLISAVLSIMLFGGTDTENIDKIPVEGGPTINLQSIVNGGNALTIPETGCTAVYGYYINNKKTGTISFTSVGEENYQGQQCIKTIGSGNFHFEILGQSIDINCDLTGYTVESEGTLLHYEYNLGYNYPQNMEMSMIVDVDKENNEIILTSNSSTGNSSIVYNVPGEYWTKTNPKELYVGYSANETYTMTSNGYSSDVNVNLTVVGKEDVTVPKGTFKDCYIIQIEVEQYYTTTTTTLWVTENGVCPKIEIEAGSTSMGLMGNMMFQLEEYYKTK